jgi:hypothetical protein
MRNNWIPEIMYEEDPDGVAQALPFILVPASESMPTVVFIWENRDTGEVEPGPNGEEIPIVDAELRQFARMDILKEKLSKSAYDDVRVALGLEKLKVAEKKGKNVTDNVVRAVAEKILSDDK